MHVELFLGLYSHLIAFLEERNRKLLEVEVRTDQIDSPVIKKFVSVAERLLSDDRTFKRVTGFDTIANKVVSGSISVKAHLPPDMQIVASVQELTIVPVESDGLILAADVLANSLNYLFRNRSDKDLYRPLNTPEAVAGHPLAAHLDAFLNWGTGDVVGDGIYRHPLAP